MTALWTEEEVSILKDMVRKGANLRELVDVFQDHTEDGIRAKLKREHIELQPRTANINHSAYQDFLNSIKGQKVKRA